MVCGLLGTASTCALLTVFIFVFFLISHLLLSHFWLTIINIIDL